jgi:hypothetical protein
VRRALPIFVVILVAAVWGTSAAAGADVPPGSVRSPDAKVDADSNAANLASAVITHAFGLLPDYIDGASLRLLPFDMFRAAEPGVTTRRLYRLTVPHTGLVLDTAVTSELTSAETLLDSKQYSIAVSLDGRTVPDPASYWVFYRNNGPLICRIYFPGDLGSLHMGANSYVLRALAPGRHLLHVKVVERIAGTPSATLITDYVLDVLQRSPDAAEIRSAPEDDADPATLGNTPLALRTPRR